MRAVGEVFASKVADALQLQHVDYSFACLNGRPELLSLCPTFIANTNMEFTSFQQYAVELDVIKNGGIQSTVQKLGLSKDVDNMLVFDYIIGNVDRHKGNAGVIRDPDSLQVVSLAPLFDNGTCMQYDFQRNRIVDYDAKFLHQSQKEELQYVRNFELVEKLDANKLSNLYTSIATQGKLCEEVICKNSERLQERVEEVKAKSMEAHKIVSMYVNHNEER